MGENKYWRRNEGYNTNRWQAHGAPKSDGGDRQDKWDAQATAQSSVQPSLPSTDRWVPADTGGQVAAPQTEAHARPSDGDQHHDHASRPWAPVHPNPITTTTTTTTTATTTTTNNKKN